MYETFEHIPDPRSAEVVYRRSVLIRQQRRYPAPPRGRWWRRSAPSTD